MAGDSMAGDSSPRPPPPQPPQPPPPVVRKASRTQGSPTGPPPPLSLPDAPGPNDSGLRSSIADRTVSRRTSQQSGNHSGGAASGGTAPAAGNARGMSPTAAGDGVPRSGPNSDDPSSCSDDEAEDAAANGPAPGKLQKVVGGVMTRFKAMRNMESRPKNDMDEEDRKLMKQTVETQVHIANAKRTSKILADDRWMPVWEVILLAATLYCEIAVTVNDIYGNWETRTHLPLDVLSSVVFCVDIGIRFRMAVHEDGRRIEDSMQIAKLYVRRWFLIDLLAALPIDVVVISALEMRRAHKYLYHLRLLRVLRVFTYFEQVNPEAICARYIWVYYQLVPLFQLFFWSVFMLHLFVIIRLALVYRSDWNTDADGQPVERNSQSFLESVYWVLYTVTSVGYGDIPVRGDGEQLYACFLFVFGVFANAAIIGKLSKMMQANNIKSERKAKMMETLAVMEYFTIPTGLQQEVLAFQNHILQHNVGSSYSQIINGLPASMQHHIGLYVRIKFITAVPIFSHACPDARVALAEALVNMVYAPGQYIINAGEIGEEMFFMGHGYADVLSPDGMYLTTVKKGGFFGEVALLIDTTRTASIRALTYCDCFRLDKADFHAILDNFPDFKVSIQEEISRREKVMQAKAAAEAAERQEERQERPRSAGLVSPERQDLRSPSRYIGPVSRARTSITETLARVRGTAGTASISPRREHAIISPSDTTMSPSYMSRSQAMHSAAGSAIGLGFRRVESGALVAQPAGTGSPRRSRLHVAVDYSRDHDAGSPGHASAGSPSASCRRVSVASCASQRRRPGRSPTAGRGRADRGSIASVASCASNVYGGDMQQAIQRALQRRGSTASQAQVHHNKQALRRKQLVVRAGIVPVTSHNDDCDETLSVCHPVFSQQRRRMSGLSVASSVWRPPERRDSEGSELFSADLVGMMSPNSRNQSAAQSAAAEYFQQMAAQQPPDYEEEVGNASVRGCPPPPHPTPALPAAPPRAGTDAHNKSYAHHSHTPVADPDALQSGSAAPSPQLFPPRDSREREQQLCASHSASCHISPAQHSQPSPSSPTRERSAKTVVFGPPQVVGPRDPTLPAPAGGAQGHAGGYAGGRPSHMSPRQSSLPPRPAPDGVLRTTGSGSAKPVADTASRLARIEQWMERFDVTLCRIDSGVRAMVERGMIGGGPPAPRYSQQQGQGRHGASFAKPRVPADRLRGVVKGIIGAGRFQKVGSPNDPPLRPGMHAPVSTAAAQRRPQARAQPLHHPHSTDPHAHLSLGGTSVLTHLSTDAASTGPAGVRDRPSIPGALDALGIGSIDGRGAPMKEPAA